MSRVAVVLRLWSTEHGGGLNTEGQVFCAHNPEERDVAGWEAHAQGHIRSASSKQGNGESHMPFMQDEDSSKQQ